MYTYVSMLVYVHVAAYVLVREKQLPQQGTTNLTASDLIWSLILRLSRPSRSRLKLPSKHNFLILIKSNSTR